MLVIVVIALAIIIAMAAAIIVLLNREPVIQLIPGPVLGEYQRDVEAIGFVVTEDNVEEVRQALAEQAERITPEDHRFEFSMTNNWTFPTARTPSPNARIRNVENNSRTIFFDIMINDLDTIVYVSPFMPLGSEHRNFALDYDLEPGTYAATITHFLVDDDFEVLTTLAIGINIIVEG